MPAPFHTGHVAEGLGLHRSIAQKIVYCLREMQLLRRVGKDRNAHLYELAAPPEVVVPPPEPKPRKRRRKAA